MSSAEDRPTRNGPAGIRTQTLPFVKGQLYPLSYRAAQKQSTKEFTKSQEEFDENTITQPQASSRKLQTGSLKLEAGSLQPEAAVVAGDVSESVLRHADAVTIGASRLLQFLSDLHPNAYAEEVDRENYASLFADQKMAANAINQLIIVLKQIPEKNDPYVQVLSDILGANSLSKARIIVPGAARDEILKANRELRIRNLVISGSDENLSSLIQSYAGRTLVYGDDDVLQGIENKRDTLKNPDDILLVQDDARSELRALALLNAIEFLNEKKDLRSFGVASAMGLLQLTENLNIRNRAELRLEQAA